MVEDIFSCKNWEVENATGIQNVRASDAAKHPTIPKIYTTHNNYPAQNVNTVEVEKS